MVDARGDKILKIETDNAIRVQARDGGVVILPGGGDRGSLLNNEFKVRGALTHSGMKVSFTLYNDENDTTRVFVSD